MSSASSVDILLVLLVSVGLSSTVGAILLYLRGAWHKPVRPGASTSSGHSSMDGAFLLWPGCWLAVRSRNMRAVRVAIGLLNPKSCSWLEGLSVEENVFIAPPVRGWIVVIGGSLPDPCEDADACFRFILALSRRFRHVQCYAASRLSRRHAWIKAENGRVIRAYAWAGSTLWNQGEETPAERQLGLKCYGYNETAEGTRPGQFAEAGINVERVPLLAARWGFDPNWIDERTIKTACGILGELPERTGEPSKRGRRL